MQCNAKSKRSGKTCTKQAVAGKTKCRYHGGLSLSGIASPSWKHGRYSKYLPPNLLGKYQEAQQDPDLLNLRDEISLVDARLKSLVEKIPEGGASHSWLELSKAWQDLITAQRNQDEAKSADCLRKLNEIITEGAEEAEVWQGIEGTIESRRKLAASEARRLIDMKQTITSEKAIALMYAVLDIIRRNVILYRDKKKVADDQLLSTIAEGVRALVTIPARPIEAEEVEV